VEIPLYQVDAFTSKRFAGNPAAICPLKSWLDDATMQALAAENNLAETAYFVEKNGDYELRWFTPAKEVDLCGHATLASASVLYRQLGYRAEEVRFHTLSGVLTVKPHGTGFAMDFPSRPPQPCTPHLDLVRSLGVEPVEVLGTRDYFVRYETESQVRAIDPDFALVKRLDRFAVIVTAPGDHCDFVSRFFAPGAGVPEDPVTGSAHCTLTPYWSEKLGKKAMNARQVSQRGGELYVEDRGERVLIAGDAVLVITGSVHLT
jgi:PhzF family phenazine biosynthesis protein